MQGNVAIEDQNYWKKNGAQYVFYDQGPLAAYRETEASLPLRWPLWYVAAKGMWEPNMTGDQILQDACNKLYGKGADAMLAYYKALAEASKQCTAKSYAWVPPSPVGRVYGRTGQKDRRGDYQGAVHAEQRQQLGKTADGKPDQTLENRENLSVKCRTTARHGRPPWLRPPALSFSVENISFFGRKP